MRVLGLDIGEKRIGVAVSDAAATIASPLQVLDAVVTLRDARPLRQLAEEYEVGLLVIGLPRSLDGTEGPQAARVRAAGERLGTLLELPVVFTDERLSSAEAARAMAAAGMSERDRRGNLDKVAAALFLQTYLDGQRDEPAARERTGEATGD